MPESLRDAVDRLARARRIALMSADTVKQKRAAFEQSIAEHLDRAKTDAAEAAEAEELVRGLALDVFMETENTKPAPGVEIKQFTTLTYDHKQALAWALEHRIALVLDKKTFEKIAPSLEFVHVAKDPRATIATDLDKALAVADATAPAPQPSVEA